MARQAPTFSTVRSEGGLLPPDLLQRIVEADADLKGFEPTDYGRGEREPVREAISRAWTRVKAFWAAFQAATEDLPRDQTGVTETREQWILPLLRTLGYRPEFHGAAEEVQGRRYLLSHRDGPVAIHVISCREQLDEPTRVSDGRRMNAHALLQEYLNRSEGRLYGLVTNGKTLRLLRDNFSLTRLAYLEFDLEAMLEGGVYADYVLLWLVLHRTRLPASETEASSCWLERWRERAETQGTRAMGELRRGVELALAELGTGLLAHPENEALRAKLRSGELTTEQFYAQLLRLLYRLLFLFVTEERDLLYPAADDGDAAQVSERSRLRDRYLAHYSLSRLREIVRRFADDDRHDDLWRGLALVFDILAGRKDGLELPSLGGGLFAAEACPDIDAGARISNRALAQAISYLSTVRVTDRSRRGRRAQWRRVNYRDIDVEELGGVYEGLLERQPRVVAEAENPRFELVGSGERKSTGSYYTPSSLVQELVKSALDPVIADRLEGKRTAQEREAALLGITVCDTAAGSGHFLLAAARRIADQLARVRAGDREPSPVELRRALRETIRSCIYGVDLNPLAVDLCRLALWLEGHEAGRPLTFLDHRIKCGNSLIGATPELAREGIPDGAFDPVTGDDKKLASAIKKRNKQEREGQLGLFDSGGSDWNTLRGALARESVQIAALPEDAPKQVAELRARYKAYRRQQFEPARAGLDAWTAAFFWSLPVDGATDPPTTAALHVPAGQVPALSEIVSAPSSV